MASKKKAPAAEDVLAAANIAIDGKHFAFGDVITGVDADQVAIARRARRVLTAAEFATREAQSLPQSAPFQDAGNEATSTGEPDEA